MKSAAQYLRVDNMKNPDGIDWNPNLSWQVKDDRQNAKQTAYQIQAASSAERLVAGVADLWDSGRVESEQSTYVAYAGAEPKSLMQACWRVKTWDADGVEGDWSDVASWSWGLLKADDWKHSKWISGPERPEKAEDRRAPYLRSAVKLAATPARAVLAVTARGLYEASINGCRISADRFMPGWTAYKYRYPYSVHDVTELMGAGDNVLDVVLGDGWYCGFFGFKGDHGIWGKTPMLRAQLHIFDSDGREVVHGTGEDWKWAFGPIQISDIYNGETYDAGQEIPAWSDGCRDESFWQPVVVQEPDEVPLSAKQTLPVREIMTISPESQKEPAAGQFVYDMGQNMVGAVRLELDVPRGTEVQLRFAEMLNPDGTIYTENLRKAKATDLYIAKGGGVEVYEPHFTFHGFRYVEITGIETAPECKAVTGVVWHTDIEKTGEFSCSNELLNKLQHCIEWGQRGNYFEVPTDCPQRNERLGWTGDAQVFIPTAAFNFDVSSFFHHWMTCMRDDQNEVGAFPDYSPTLGRGARATPAWGDAGVICPWVVYERYGDRRILEDNYEAMGNWVNCLKSQSTALIFPSSEFTEWMGYGDWLAPDVKEPGDAPTPKDLIGTAYFAYCCQILEKTASLIGKDDDVARYRELGTQVKQAFCDEFVSERGRIAGDTQTGYLLALGFDLLPEAKRPRAVEMLVRKVHEAKDHIRTGFVGTGLFAPVLTRFGHADLVYEVLLQQTYPGWLYPVLNGATTMWERWDSWTEKNGFHPAGMNSFNHYAYGCIGDWLYSTVAGLGFDPDKPGYKHIVFSPQPGGDLTSASASLRTMYGTASIEWVLDGGEFKMEVTVPANATASIVLPEGCDIGDVTVNGTALQCGADGVEVGAGRYEVYAAYALE